MKDKTGAAVHDRCPPLMPSLNAGGGMSASENRMVNHKGRTIGKMGAAKVADGGKDLSKGAKNKISGPAGLLTKEQSPTAWPQSRNKGSKYK